MTRQDELLKTLVELGLKFGVVSLRDSAIVAAFSKQEEAEEYIKAHADNVNGSNRQAVSWVFASEIDTKFLQVKE